MNSPKFSISSPEQLVLFGNNFNLAKGKEKRGEKTQGEGALAEGRDGGKKERELLISIDFLIRFHILKCASNLRSDIC